jgi:hypothetical protein
MNSRNQRANAINDYFLDVIVQEIMEYDDDVKLKAIHNKEKVNIEIPEYVEASCDVCVKGWNYENEFGLCDCECDNCGYEMRECQYKCYDVRATVEHLEEYINKYQPYVRSVDINIKQKFNKELIECIELDCYACMGGWNFRNEFGLCNCMCNICYGCYRDCRGECRE